MLVVRTLSESNIDQGTYESDCNVVNGSIKKQRVIVNCDKDGNIIEVSVSTREYTDSQCKNLYLDLIFVASISLSSGTIDNHSMILVLS